MARHKNEFIDKEKLKKIRKLFAEGIEVWALAERFGIPASRVSMLVTGKKKDT